MGVADLAMQNDDSSFLFVTCFSHRFWGGRQNKRKTIHIKADKHETSEAGQYLPHPKFTEQTHTGDCSIFRIFTYSDSHSIISCWSWWWCDFWSRITVHFVVINCTRKEAIARSIQWDIHSKLLGGVCWNLLNMLNIQWITRWSPRTRMLTRMLMVQMSKHMVMQSRTIPFCNSLFEQSCACFPCYQSAVWSGKCRVWSVECEVRSVECKVWSGECRVCKV